eukprot:c24583_g1_i4 orf=347-607(-)
MRIMFFHMRKLSHFVLHMRIYFRHMLKQCVNVSHMVNFSHLFFHVRKFSLIDVRKFSCEKIFLLNFFRSSSLRHLSADHGKKRHLC